MPEGSLDNKDKFIADTIRRFVNEFQRIEVNFQSKGKTVCVHVHPPYMLQSVKLIENTSEFEKLKERHRDRLKNVKIAREDANDDLSAFLNSWFYDDYGSEKHVACGRAAREDIRDLLQEAVDRNFVPFAEDKGYPTGRDLRMWLKKYGIGIDCSGFVQQTLERLIAVSYAENRQEVKRHHKGVIGFLRCGWSHREITAGSQNKES